MSWSCYFLEPASPKNRNNNGSNIERRTNSGETEHKIYLNLTEMSCFCFPRAEVYLKIFKWREKIARARKRVRDRKKEREIEREYSKFTSVFLRNAVSVPHACPLSQLSVSSFSVSSFSSTRLRTSCENVHLLIRVIWSLRVKSLYWSLLSNCKHLVLK